MKSDSTTVIKNMEFLVKELHKEWDRSGASKASVIITLEEVDGINDMWIFLCQKVRLSSTITATGSL